MKNVTHMVSTGQIIGVSEENKNEDDESKSLSDAQTE